jgi:glutamate racemase
MIGIFDSGVGGLNTLFALRDIDPTADVILFRDTKNAPFGTKSQAELIQIVTNGVRRLLDSGADRVLLGCCTASCVYDFLPHELKKRTVPIVAPTAKAALKATLSSKIALLATARTVSSGAFLMELNKRDKNLSLLSIKAGELVTYVESGGRDNNVSPSLYNLLLGYKREIEHFGADTLILGCTHFPSLYFTFKHLLPNMSIISSAHVGALTVAHGGGVGRTVYIS